MSFLLDFYWAKRYWDFLKPDGIMVAMSDYKSQHRFRVFVEDALGGVFVNHAVWKNEWGSHPRNRLHQCYDDVMIYSKGKSWKFYSDRIQVPKKTIGKGLNPSGRLTKTATAWIEDCVLTTTSRERVKAKNGHLIRWQKPLSLINRILLPFTDPGDLVVDCFMGSGSVGEWCGINERLYVGIENDLDVFDVAKERLRKFL
jgi:DNA modification methylase